MFKKVFFVLFLFLANTFNAFAVVTGGLLPTGTGLPGDGVSADNVALEIGGKFIAEMIKYVAVIAVISLMVSGILYLISGGEEEKVKTAKTWIIYSLVGVLLSVSAWSIIQIINELNIT